MKFNLSHYDENTTLTRASVAVSSQRVVASKWHEEGATATAELAVSKTHALEISPMCESAEKADGWVVLS